jgi:hydrogenase small subunit
LRHDGSGVVAAGCRDGADCAGRSTTDKPVLIWLEFQDCAGSTESFLRASRPTAAEVILDMLSVDYHETIMAAAGVQAEQNRDTTVKQRAGSYIAIDEGSIPTGANGAY